MGMETGLGRVSAWAGFPARPVLHDSMQVPSSWAGSRCMLLVFISRDRVPFANDPTNDLGFLRPAVNGSMSLHQFSSKVSFLSRSMFRQTWSLAEYI